MKTNKIYKFFGIGIVAIATLYIVSCFIIYKALTSHPNNNYDISLDWDKIDSLYPGIAKWTDSIRTTGALHDSVITTSDGNKIQTYWIYAKQPTPKTVVLIHGINSSAIQIMHLAHMYHHDLHYNVFLYDQYAHGKSDGDEIDMGRLNKENAILCINFIYNNKEFYELNHSKPNIIVHGISMGAVTAMQLSGDVNAPSCIKAYIEDCGYTDFIDIIEYTAENTVNADLPAFPITSASLICQWENGWSFEDVSPIEDIKHCKRPMMFIHGSEDEIIPLRMAKELYDSHPGPKKLWIANGAKHAESYYINPTEYTKQVCDFLNIQQ